MAKVSYSSFRDNIRGKITNISTITYELISLAMIRNIKMVVTSTNIKIIY